MVFYVLIVLFVFISFLSTGHHGVGKYVLIAANELCFLAFGSSKPRREHFSGSEYSTATVDGDKVI